jgi:hypothetical protein
MRVVRSLAYLLYALNRSGSNATSKQEEIPPYFSDIHGDKKGTEFFNSLFYRHSSKKDHFFK